MVKYSYECHSFYGHMNLFGAFADIISPLENMNLYPHFSSSLF